MIWQRRWHSDAASRLQRMWRSYRMRTNWAAYAMFGYEHMIIEFQQRGVPHAHILYDINMSEEAEFRQMEG